MASKKKLRDDFFSYLVLCEAIDEDYEIFCETCEVKTLKFSRGTPLGLSGKKITLENAHTPCRSPSYWCATAMREGLKLPCKMVLNDMANFLVSKNWGATKHHLKG